LTSHDDRGQQERELILKLREWLVRAEPWFQEKRSPAQSGSAFAGDDRETHPHDLSHAVTFAFGIAVDHLHAMQMSLTALGPDRLDLHTYADFTGARAAIEGASRALWIASPRSRDERILRHLRLELESANANLSFIKDAGLPPNDKLVKRRDRILKLADARGLALADVERKPSPTGYVKDAGESVGMLRSDGVNLLYLLWRMCSAIAHGDKWVIQLFPTEVLEEIRPGVYMAQLTAPTSILVSAVQAAITVLLKAREVSEQRGRCHL
jgi:hypothetical protein